MMLVMCMMVVLGFSNVLNVIEQDLFFLLNLFWSIRKKLISIISINICLGWVRNVKVLFLLYFLDMTAVKELLLKNLQQLYFVELALCGILNCDQVDPYQ